MGVVDGEPAWKIVYHQSVVDEDVPAIGSADARRIATAIAGKLARYPQLYGAPLRGTLRPLWKLRVGDWRVVYDIADRTVRVITVGHRRDIYRTAARRD